jgi:shikimate kinase/shikimate kinase/3-dehydroquinate synthase
LGGGAFLNKNIRTEVLKNHLSFWLKIDAKTIIERIINNPKRPIAFNSTKNELLYLIKKRSKIYSKSMYNIICDNLTKKDIVKKVLNIYETK